VDYLVTAGDKGLEHSRTTIAYSRIRRDRDILSKVELLKYTAKMITKNSRKLPTPKIIDTTHWRLKFPPAKPTN